jgi:sugar phosphate isomerase/epimerase
MTKIACQTIVFGDNIRDNYASIAEKVKKMGYDGIETGVRHFCLDRVEFYQELLGRLDLILIAIHVGGNFLDRDSVSQQLDNVKNIISFGKKLNCPYLYLSGLNKEGKTRGDYAVEAKSYAEIGKMCVVEGITLCYHNHDWEFYKDGSEGMKTLLDNVPSELMKLVPDVGWLEVAGIKPVQFLKDNISRIQSLHFKDFKSTAVLREFTELGMGVVPFREIHQYVASLGREWWITAEQDNTALAPEEAARINFGYIDGLRKQGKH